MLGCESIQSRALENPSNTRSWYGGVAASATPETNARSAAPPKPWLAITTDVHRNAKKFATRDRASPAR
jgi:hypothetical protein